MGLVAQRRKAATARLVDGGVRELRTRPPETLLLGASVSNEVKCRSVRQRAHVDADLGQQPAVLRPRTCADGGH
jgi:hypothetical protein